LRRRWSPDLDGIQHEGAGSTLWNQQVTALRFKR
jgi:hypothetical protein